MCMSRVGLYCKYTCSDVFIWLFSSFILLNCHKLDVYLHYLEYTNHLLGVHVVLFGVHGNRTLVFRQAHSELYLEFMHF